MPDDGPWAGVHDHLTGLDLNYAANVHGPAVSDNKRMTQPPPGANTSPPGAREPAPAPPMLDVAAVIGALALTFSVALGAAIAVPATLVTAIRTLTVAAGESGAPTTSGLEAAGVLTVLLILMSVPAAAGCALSKAGWAKGVGAVGAGVLAALATALLLATAIWLAGFSPRATPPLLGAFLNTLFGCLLLGLGCAITIAAGHPRVAGYFVYPMLAVFFVDIVAIVGFGKLAIDATFALNLAFILIVAAVIAALGLFGRNQELMREK